MADYFSDRENGPRARTEQVISPTVGWCCLPHWIAFHHHTPLVAYHEKK
jgi:hypothetical protein